MEMFSLRSLSVPILLCVVLGLVVAGRPAHRRRYSDAYKEYCNPKDLSTMARRWVQTGTALAGGNYTLKNVQVRGRRIVPSLFTPMHLALGRRRQLVFRHGDRTPITSVGELDNGIEVWRRRRRRGVACLLYCAVLLSSGRVRSCRWRN